MLFFIPNFDSWKTVLFTEVTLRGVDPRLIVIFPVQRGADGYFEFGSSGIAKGLKKIFNKERRGMCLFDTFSIFYKVQFDYLNQGDYK